MKKNSIFLIISIAYMGSIYSQPTIEWQKSLGGSSGELPRSIQQTNDQGYIIAGASASIDGDISGNHGGSDCWIVKLDIGGNILWQKTLGGSGHDGAYAIQETGDMGYIIAGISDSNDGDVTGNHGGIDYWIVKLDSGGNILWQKTLGGSGDEIAYSIQEIGNMGYVVVGYSNSNNGNVSGNHGDNDCWVVKLDNSGNIQWQKSLGGSAEDRAYSIQKTNDNGFVIAGYSYSNNGDVFGNHGIRDCWIVKLTSTGNIQWQRMLGGSWYDDAWSIQQTNDEGFIVVGTTGSSDGDVFGNNGGFDFWVIKLDTDGNITWQKPLGGGGDELARGIQKTNDGGYIIAGVSNFSWPSSYYNYLIIKTNAEGLILWQKEYGGTEEDQPLSIQQTLDGGYIIAGSSNSNDGDVSGNHGDSDYWVVKLASTVINTSDTWVQRASFAGTPRFGSFGFSIGSKGYIGTGSGSNIGIGTSDFWEYNQTTDTWAQKANYGGGAVYYGKGFSIGSKGYAGLGYSDPEGFRNDFWEYDPATNMWTKKADFPGGARMDAVAFSIGDKGYIGTGYDAQNNLYKDFWEYDPMADTWTKKADFAGAPKRASVGFSIGTKGYIGTGSESIGVSRTEDLWEYDPVTDTWTQKANVPGGPRTSAAGFSIGDRGYIGLGVTDITSPTDFWEYNPQTNSWAKISDYKGETSVGAVGFSIGTKGYIGTGISNQTTLSVREFWEYTPECSGNLPIISPPPKPEVVDAKNIKLSWENHCDGFAYNIYRMDMATGVQVNTYYGSNNFYEDSDPALQPNHVYQYRMQMVSQTSLVPISPPVEVTTPSDILQDMADLRPQGLAISSLAGTSWGTGEQVELWVGISNIGTAIAAASQARLYLLKSMNEPLWNSPLGDPVPFPMIGISQLSTQSLNVTIPANLEPGDYYIGIEADAFATVTDRNRLNNRKIKQVPITITNAGMGINLPDLVISIQDISSREWTSNTPISWKVKIQNLGSAPSESSILRLKMMYQGSSDEIVLKNELIPTIPAQGQQTFEFSAFQVPGNPSPGDYFLQAVVDATNLITEINETNNGTSFGIVHYKGNGDIKISGRIVTPDGKMVAGVTLMGLPGNPVTDYLGYYQTFVTSGWSGKVTPKKNYYRIFQINDSQYSALDAFTYENVTSAASTDYLAINIGEMVEKIVTNTELAKFLIHDIKAQANTEALLEAYKFVGFARAAYGILNKKEDDITKYFDLIDLSVKVIGTLSGASGTASFGIGTYMYITKKTLELINKTIAEYYRQINFNFFPENLNFFLKIEDDDLLFNDVSPSTYISHLKAYLNMYDGTLGQGKINFIDRREMSIEVVSNNKTKLKVISPFSDIALDGVYTIELIWNPNNTEREHTFIIPAREPFIKKVFVSSTDYNIELKLENGHDLTNRGSLLLGIEYLKIKN